LLRDFLAKIVRRTIFAVGLIVGLTALEINIGPLLAVIGAAGFVVAFALQSTLGNFASGLMILMYRPFDVGDVIDVAGVSGKVESMNLTSTQIKTFDNKVVIVPNNSIWGGIITNVTGSNLRRVDMTFGIGYGDDIAKAQSVLEELVRKHQLILDEPEPVIKMHELADSSVNFICRPWAKTPDYWTVYWDITRSVKEEFDRRGISIPFPQRDVHIYQESPAGKQA
jgi:small conductance mechanosensitive channel